MGIVSQYAGLFAYDDPLKRNQAIIESVEYSGLFIAQGILKCLSGITLNIINLFQGYERYKHMKNSGVFVNITDISDVVLYKTLSVIPSNIKYDNHILYFIEESIYYYNKLFTADRYLFNLNNNNINLDKPIILIDLYYGNLTNILLSTYRKIADILLSSEFEYMVFDNFINDDAAKEAYEFIIDNHMDQGDPKRIIDYYGVCPYVNHQNNQTDPLEEINLKED